MINVMTNASQKVGRASSWPASLDAAQRSRSAGRARGAARSRRQRGSVQALVCLLDCLHVEAQGRSQPRHGVIGEGVLRAQQVRDPGPRARILRHQIGPLGGVPLEILDGGLDGQVTPLGQRIEERSFALGGRALAEDDRDRLRFSDQQGAVRFSIANRSRVERRADGPPTSSSRENNADSSDANAVVPQSA